MYLAEVNTWDVVRKQYRYKLKSYMGVFTSLIVIQILAILFSFNGTGMSSGGGLQSFTYSVNYYSGSMIPIFTMIWGLSFPLLSLLKHIVMTIIRLLPTGEPATLLTFYFLLSASIFAGVTVLLCTHFIQVFQVFYAWIQSQ